MKIDWEHLHREWKSFRLHFELRQSRKTRAGRMYWWVRTVTIAPFLLTWLATEWVWAKMTHETIRPHQALWGLVQWAVIWILFLSVPVERPLWPGIWLAVATMAVIHVRAWRNREIKK